ncbi:MAG: tryptophan synthase subunit alpha [Chloroflexi bacterium]|nr:tryptophan synthase subunit alpha [Chloroflexota bacterium]MDA1270051.1 tryptophan synthase subunit alpha [Chloroflexota bacterium]
MFDKVREQKRPGLIVFLTAGFPDMKATLELVPALVAAGADMVELGVPFSDPLAEGPVIQESSFLALQNGTSLEDCLNAVETLRDKVPETPLVLMGYYNPIHTYGLVPFTERCRQVGVDGLIAVDLPGFESGPLISECQTRDISVIPLLAPTSTDRSIKEACAGASGFIYCISVTGVTGARDQVSARGFDLLDRVKAHTDLPLAVGFGISNRGHVEEVGKTAEAAVVGSAMIRVMLDSPRDELVERTTRFVAGLAGVSLPA